MNLKYAIGKGLNILCVLYQLMQPAIRLSEKNYQRLLKIKGELIKRTGKDKTFDDVIEWVLNKFEEIAK